MTSVIKKNGEEESKARTVFHISKSSLYPINRLTLDFKTLPRHGAINGSMEGEIKERLDRGLCSPDRFLEIENMKCTHINNEASDHQILMIDTRPDQQKRKKRFV